ncbi:MAG: hypothetical protein M5Z89_08515 [Olivibacter sp.]|nr:hypothetical protein [Olivibacter sp. UJ_SKK_5.1]
MDGLLFITSNIFGVILITMGSVCTVVSISGNQNLNDTKIFYSHDKQGVIKEIYFFEDFYTKITGKEGMLDE